MTNTVKIGPYRIAPHKRAGRLTGRWFLDIPRSIAGRRLRQLFANREEAVAAANDLIRGFAKEQISRRNGPRAEPSISFEEAEQRWLLEQERRVAVRKKAASSLDRDKWNLKAAKAFFGNVMLDQITTESLERFQAWRIKEGRKPDTINGDIQMVLKLMRWAHRHNLLRSIPLVDLIPSDAGRNLQVPTPEEVVRVIEALPSYNRLVVRFIAETGCRSGEAFNLRWDAVDLQNRIAHIGRSEDWTPKTRHSQRNVGFSSSLAAELKPNAKRDGLVFPSPKSPGKRRTNIRKSLSTAVRKANVVRGGKRLRVTLHTLRKAYATWAVADVKMPVRQLQEQMGHAPGSKMTNKHYIGMSRDMREQCVMPLPKIGVVSEVAT